MLDFVANPTPEEQLADALQAVKDAIGKLEIAAKGGDRKGTDDNYKKVPLRHSSLPHGICQFIRASTDAVG